MFRGSGFGGLGFRDLGFRATGLGLQSAKQVREAIQASKLLQGPK